MTGMARLQKERKKFDHSFSLFPLDCRDRPLCLSVGEIESRRCRITLR